MQPERLGGSVKVATVAGIGIYLHWTFAALIGWLFLASIIAGKSISQSLFSLAFIGSLFACVVLHELGHALAAKRFGIRTRDIILLPIGGVARLERIPEKPSQEFWVALAGPIVNVLIVCGIVIFLQFHSGVGSNAAGFATRLMWLNILMAGFNLLPAFPMDGGRILRALLAMRIGRLRATAVAARIGQYMAVLFGIIGFFQNPFLIFIAIFVYFGAQAEAELVETTSLIQGLQVRDAMMRRFRALAPEDTLAKAVTELLAGSQDEFPVITDSKVEGVLRPQDIVKGLAERGDQIPVRELATQQCVSVEATAPLEQTLEQMRREGCRTVPVFETGKMVGLLTLENISELIMVRSALSGSARTRFAHPA
jgi:Zn-dependent protease/predicted transcriptional regulator